jgi:hypothetical protein
MKCGIGVVAATVNVLCELARQNPAEYLSLAPQLFHLLTSSSNNWMLIKIIKLVCRLTDSRESRPSSALVWCPMSARATAREETAAAYYRSHHQYAGYLTPLRMRSHSHHRRHATRS